MGRCIKPKIRSAYDQHPTNPTSTAATEKTMRRRSSSRWASSGMECARWSSTEAAPSDMENLVLSSFRRRCRCGFGFDQSRTIHLCLRNEAQQFVGSERWSFVDVGAIEGSNQYCSQSD